MFDEEVLCNLDFNGLIFLKSNNIYVFGSKCLESYLWYKALI